MDLAKSINVSSAVSKIDKLKDKNINSSTADVVSNSSVPDSDVVKAPVDAVKNSLGLGLNIAQKYFGSMNPVSSEQSSVEYSDDIRKQVGEFLRNSCLSCYNTFVTSMMQNGLPEEAIKEFITSGDIKRSKIITEFSNSSKKIYKTIYFSPRKEIIDDPRLDDILTSLSLMKLYYPNNYHDFLRSSGYKAIKKGELSICLLGGIKASDKIGNDYFLDLFDKKEEELKERVSKSSVLRQMNPKVLKRIVDIDIARQDEILDALSSVSDVKGMNAFLNNFVMTILTKENERKTNLTKKGVFYTPDNLRVENAEMISLIKLVSENVELSKLGAPYLKTVCDYKNFINTLKQTKLTDSQVFDTYAKFNDAKNKKFNVYLRDVIAGIKFMETYNDASVLDKLLQADQKQGVAKILSDVNQNNISLFKFWLNNQDEPISDEQLSTLLVTKAYPESKSPEGVSKIISAKDEVLSGLLNRPDKNYNLYVETFNRLGLIDIKMKDPEKFEKIKESGLLDMVDSGKLSSAILKNLNINSDFSHEVYEDLEAVKQGKSIVAEFEEGTSISDAFSKTKLGDVIEIGKKMYLNNGESLEEWKMSKEKYLELFPPVLRFVTRQGSLGDCYFVASLNSSMRNPLARLNIYRSFEQLGDDIAVTIKAYDEYGGANVFKGGNISLDDCNAHLYGSKGLQMYEQTYAQKALRPDTLDCTPFLNSDTSMHTLMTRIKSGYVIDAMSEIHSLDRYPSRSTIPNNINKGTYNIKNNTPDLLEGLLKRMLPDKSISLNFSTTPKRSHSPESKLLPEYSLVSSHAYSIVGYDEATKTVIINNPHNAGTDTKIPLSTLSKYVDNISVSKFA